MEYLFSSEHSELFFFSVSKVNDLEQVRQREQKHNVSSLPPVQNYFHLCIQTHKERASGGVRIYGMTKSLIVVALCAVNPRRPFSS